MSGEGLEKGGLIIVPIIIVTVGHKQLLSCLYEATGIDNCGSVTYQVIVVVVSILPLR
jgi:hypothetical protein